MTSRVSCGIALFFLAACDPLFRYRIIAHDAAKAGEPLAGARAILSCGDPYAMPCAITGMDGGAACGGLPGAGLPLDCRLEIRRRGFVSRSTDLQSICTDGDLGRCRFGEWSVEFQRSGQTVPPSRVAPPASPSCASPDHFNNSLGSLLYRRCASGELEVASLRLNTFPLFAFPPLAWGD